MAIIYSYPRTIPSPSDLMLLNVTTNKGNETKTATIADLVSLIPGIVPGGGTVTSVGLSIDNSTALSVSALSTPITTSGTLALQWNGDNTQVVLGDGTLGNYETGGVVSVASGDTNTITISGTATDPTVAANTAAVTNGSNNLATGDQIYDFVIDQGYSTVEELNDLSDVLYSSRGLFVGEVPAGVIAPAQYNVSLGNGALINITGGRFDTAIGESALASVTTGTNNTAVGGLALGYLQTGNDNTAVGYDAGGKTEGNNNVFLGESAGYNTNSDDSVFIGFRAGLREGQQSVLIGSQTGLEGNVGLSPEKNTFLGYKAGYGFGGSKNIFIGCEVASRGVNEASSTGSNNIAIGTGALYDLEDGNTNLAIGQDALKNITSGSENFAIGYKAGESLQFGDSPRSTFIGHYAGQSNGANGANVAIGYNCLNADASGTSNVAIGKDTLPLLVNSGIAGNYGGNVAIGIDAGQSQTSGEENTYIGNRAGSGITASSRNTIIGAVTSGTPPDTGNDNTLIGVDANTSKSNGANQIVIGSGATGHDDNIAVIGNAATTSIDPHDDNTTSLGTIGHGFTALVLASPNGTKYTITVSDAGTLVVT